MRDVKERMKKEKGRGREVKIKDIHVRLSLSTSGFNLRVNTHFLPGGWGETLETLETPWLRFQLFCTK